MPLVGQQLGPYRLLTLIKSSNKSEIYGAESISQHQRVVVTAIPLDQMLYPNPAMIKKAIALFHQEASRVSRLAHPFLNPLLSYGEEKLGGMIYLYLVMPASADGTLNDYLQRSKDLLEPEDVTRMVGQIAAALQYIHAQHLVHGAVKPSCIVVQSSDIRHIYEVRLDGLAETRCIIALYSASAIRGNPTYLAPEQWKAHSDAGSDQYALAVLAYKLLTGHAPFQGTLEQLKQQHYNAQAQRASVLNGQIACEVDDVLLRALAKETHNRYSSIDRFAQALQQAIQPQSRAQQQQKRQGAFSRRNTTSIIGPTPGKASLLLYLLCTGIAGLVTCVILNAYGILPPSIAHLGTALGGLIAFIAGSWALFERFFSKEVWRQARRFPAIILSLLTVTIVLSIAIYLPSQTLDTYTHAGQPAFYDQLANNTLQHNWPVGQNAQRSGGCVFLQGAYHGITLSNPYLQPCISSSDNSNFDNFVYEVRMTLVKGDCGGIIFRANIMMGNLYLFSICKNRAYELVTYKNYKVEASLDNGFLSLSLNMAGPLLIAVVARGSSITLYVNHHQVNPPIPDSTLDGGHIGVFASSTNNPTEVAFRDAQVWSLDSQNSPFSF